MPRPPDKQKQNTLLIISFHPTAPGLSHIIINKAMILTEKYTNSEKQTHFIYFLPLVVRSFSLP